MIINLILLTLLGIILGTFTGLLPGIHTNLIASLIIASLTFLLEIFTPLEIIILIVSMNLTHTFLNFIPSIYIGAPDEDTALSVLPGHEYLLKGEAHKAYKLTLLGSAYSILLLIIVIPLIFFILPKSIIFIERMMSLILIWISIFLIYDNKKKVNAILIFFLAGFLGSSSLNLPISEPIFPLLTGLFGTSTIISSLNSSKKIPPQIIQKLNIKKRDLFKPLIGTSIISPICSILPGLGSSQAAIIGSKLTGKISKDQFMILLGSINTLVITTSFFTLYLLGKTRTGAAKAISEITKLGWTDLKIILIVIIISSIISSLIGLKTSKLFARNIQKIDYRKLSLGILTLLIILTILMSGPLGLFVLIISTSLGILCTMLEVRKSLLMACLLVPTIIYYFPF